MAFTTRAIEAETLGIILQKARTSHGWELKDAERRIGIPVRYLEFLEADDFYKLPSPTYTRGFLERYAQFLQLNPEEIINRWKQESAEFLEQKIWRKKRVKRLPLAGLKKNRFLLSFNIKTVLTTLILLVVFIYLGLGIKRILLPPQIEIFSPSEDLITRELSLIIKGRTEVGADVFINQEPVSEISQGYFQENLELLPGLNIIEISAKKKYSRERVIQRRVVVEE